MAAKKAKKSKAVAVLPAMTLYETDREGVQLLEFRDDLISADGKKKTKVKGKGVAGCGLAARLGAYLQKYNVPNFYLDTQDKDGMLVQAAEPFGFSVKVSNFAGRELAGRLGLPDDGQLRCPVIEYYYHNAALKNPRINQYHAVALDLAGRDDMERINELALKANAVLKPYMSRRGLNLTDFEIGMGRVDGETVITSPLCLDYCSIAAIDGSFAFDRTAFTADSKKIRAAYQAAADNLAG